MKTQLTKRTAGLLTTGVAALGLALGIGFSPTANAAQDCGQGYHLDGATCVVNAPGPGARPAGPGCWYNDLGDYRCYPGA